MQFNFEFTASAEDVFKKITDPQFITDRCIALGSLQAECTSDGNALPEITIKRVEEAELPAMMKKILGNEQKLATVEQWSETDETYDSVSKTIVEGAPIQIEARQSLYNTEDGSEMSVNLVVTASVPLIGKKVEAMVAIQVKQEVLKELEYVETS